MPTDVDLPTPLIAREVRLQELILTPEYFYHIRCAYKEMLDYVEQLLERFMRQLPDDYRSRRRPYQPDIVWGGRVLPNFRSTLDSYNRAFLEFRAGDFDSARRMGGAARGDHKGQLDFSYHWMDEVEPGASDKYYRLLVRAKHIERPFETAANGVFSPRELTDEYQELYGKKNIPLTIPTKWPIYRLNHDVKVKTGDPITQTGFYLPDVPHGFPTYIFVPLGEEQEEACEAYVEKAGDETYTYVPCTWTLIEKVAETGGEPGWVEASASPIDAGDTPPRTPAGQPCPRTGYWITPARADSRQRFEAGQTMPDAGGTVGETIWQWDVNQG